MLGWELRITVTAESGSKIDYCILRLRLRKYGNITDFENNSNSGNFGSNFGNYGSNFGSNYGSNSINFSIYSNNIIVVFTIVSITFS